MRSNKRAGVQLVSRISQLLESIYSAFLDRSNNDIDAGLKADIEHFPKCVTRRLFEFPETDGSDGSDGRDLEKIRHILALNPAGNADEIARCKELVNRSFERFLVRSSITKIMTIH